MEEQPPTRRTWQEQYAYLIPSTSKIPIDPEEARYHCILMISQTRKIMKDLEKEIAHLQLLLDRSKREGWNKIYILQNPVTRGNSDARFVSVEEIQEKLALRKRQFDNNESLIEELLKNLKEIPK